MSRFYSSAATATLLQTRFHNLTLSVSHSHCFVLFMRLGCLREWKMVKVFIVAVFTQSDEELIDSSCPFAEVIVAL